MTGYEMFAFLMLRGMFSFFGFIIKIILRIIKYLVRWIASKIKQTKTVKNQENEINEKTQEQTKSPEKETVYYRTNMLN